MSGTARLWAGEGTYARTGAPVENVVGYYSGDTLYCYHALRDDLDVHWSAIPCMDAPARVATGSVRGYLIDGQHVMFASGPRL